MTRTIWPEGEVQALKPEYVAPIVAVLCSGKPPADSEIFEAGAGWYAKTRFQRARGVDFDFKKGCEALTVEMVAEVSVQGLVLQIELADVLPGIPENHWLRRAG